MTFSRSESEHPDSPTCATAIRVVHSAGWYAKVANEAPADIKSNLTRAWANFNQEKIDGCNKPTEYKACLFSLCWFHSIVLGKRESALHAGLDRPSSKLRHEHVEK